MHLKTERLILRPYVMEDATRLYQAINASLPELKPWMVWAQEESSLEKGRATITHFHKEMAEEREIPLAIFLHDGTFVGSSGYFIRDKADKDVPKFELGYWQDSRHAKMGYIREAVTAQTTALFNNLGANRVEIHCNADNHNSANVALKLGFALEGRLRNERRHLGKLADSLIFSHIPESWQAFLVR